MPPHVQLESQQVFTRRWMGRRCCDRARPASVGVVAADDQRKRQDEQRKQQDDQRKARYASVISIGASDPSPSQQPALHALREQQVTRERHGQDRPVQRPKSGEAEVSADGRTAGRAHGEVLSVDVEKLPEAHRSPTAVVAPEPTGSLPCALVTGRAPRPSRSSHRRRPRMMSFMMRSRTTAPQNATKMRPA